MRARIGDRLCVHSRIVSRPDRMGDVVEVRGPDDLARLGPGPIAGPGRILGAAVLGRTRLIDNLAV